jgi:Uma2 family endonuclease
MAEPVRKLPISEHREWDDEEAPDFPRLVRVVERAAGEVEILDVPLTPELFLYQEMEDKIVQRPIHAIVCTDLFGLLRRRYAGRPDVLVLFDAHHYLKTGERPLAPDISVTFGPGEDLARGSFDVAKEGAVPSLIIEVVSPDKKSIREVDTRRKPRIYRRAGVPEYIVIDPPRPRKPGFKVGGLRLGPRGRYRKIRPDAGYILSETTGLLFPASAEGERLVILDAKTRLPLPYPEDTEAALKAAEEKAIWEAKARRTAEEKAAREATARRAAEAEMARLREELERLKSGKP